ncbi:hypothetical protein LJF28_15945 [Chryseobacterium indologenes]|uniref:TaqI-like C-terminal specificity domain-containing protein n=1 Tax=Chryseobacterium indologenes TaxID=253 RepID=UPI001D0D3E82|nr:TaqI-like C-terminal specificity domain-containing protein [Chryseobacterium indologenes]UDQ52923.1 hypothetical protein LJF28_15945 [Chryseobacterium indologenes]
MSDYFRRNSSLLSFSNSDSWVILSPIEQQIKEKIEKIGTPLKDWDIRINYGIKTGFNDAFIIDGAKRKELIDQDPKSEEIIRPILRGRDIKRYAYESSDLWLINTHNGIKEKGIKPIDINVYPAIKNYLDKFYPQLEKRTDKGDTPYNLRNCAYMEDFYRQKIVWKIIGDQMAFFIDNKNFIVNNACYILTGNYLEYLVIILNSKIIKWYSYLTNMNKTGVGDMQVGAQNVVLFPIPILTENEQKPFKALLQKILLAKQNNEDSTELEKLSNNLVYSTYNLIDEEIKFIDQL